MPATFYICIWCILPPVFYKFVCFAHIQPVPKKGDCSNPSKYRSTTLLSCLSKAFEMGCNRKVLKHLPSSDLVSHRQYGFRKGRSTGDLLSFPSFPFFPYLPFLYYPHFLFCHWFFFPSHLSSSFPFLSFISVIFRFLFFPLPSLHFLFFHFF